MAKGKWYNNIARVIFNPKKKSYFLKFERPQDFKTKKFIGDSPFPLTINEGDIFQAKLKREDLKRLVDAGTMTQDLADKICETTKFEFSIAPKDDEPSTPKSNTSEDSDDDEVEF